MLHIPVAKVISRIKEETGLSENEIQEQIKKKLNTLEGLVSKEGAAYIIASELGVQLFKDIGAGQKKIKHIISGMQSVDVVGKVIRTFPPVTFISKKDGQESQVGSFLVGDCCMGQTKSGSNKRK
jgi:ssDNA-binding replication factor A large subunit